MTQHSEQSSNKRKHYMSEYRHLQMKKAEEPNYLQHPIKIIAEVQAIVEVHKNTSKTEVSAAKT